MARVTRASARQAASSAEGPDHQPGISTSNRSPASAKSEPEDNLLKRRRSNTAHPQKRVKTEKREPSTGRKLSEPVIKPEPSDETLSKAPALLASTANSPGARKIKSYTQYAAKSPFPDFPHPTPDEARRVHRILASLHGARVRPEETKAPTSRSGCGDSPSVLDALVRTILSQNTSNANSTRAKQSMDAEYGGSDNWEGIAAGGTPRLQEAIKCGGLSVTKSKVIMSILSEVKERYGCYSLDHLFNASNEDAMQELTGFKGVGPKTASCVLLFCLRRESFAVDTHVWRITGLLGWRPTRASRDETHAHLDVRIPDEEKYGLHVLLVTHGRICAECKAGGRSFGKCELRKKERETS